MTENKNNLQEHIRAEEARLDRIEQKIDKLSEAMIDLARAEEKLFNMEKTHAQLYERQNRHSERMDELDKRVGINERTVRVINAFLYILTAAVVSAVIKMFLGG